MKEIEVQSVEDLKMLIVVGEKQRTVASTVMNTNRYITVCTLELGNWPANHNWLLRKITTSYPVN